VAIKSTDTEVNKYKVTWEEVYKRIEDLKKYITGNVYGIPRGGQIIAGLIGKAVDRWEEANVLVDDIFDSGKTTEEWISKTGLDMFHLFDKRKELKGKWIEFPWENTEQDIEDTVIRQLEYVGEDVSREGLIDTPKRVIKSWNKLYGGYKESPKDILSRTFTEKHNQMVILKHIEFYSTCEHHMLSFMGDISLGYIPNGKVVGVSKLARLVECFARRLQIQERMTDQIVEAIDKYLKPQGVICVCNAQHLCMTSRGIEKQHSIMTTSALRGVFVDNINARQEFLRLIER
jgi:GTP cyclohydrolase I